jgi:hypothetical protein
MKSSAPTTLVTSQDRSRNRKKYLALSAIAMLAFSLPSGSRAESIEELKATIREMQSNMELLVQKVETLEKQQAKTAEVAKIAADSAGGSMVLPKDTTVKLYGYAKLDGLYTDVDGGGKSSYVPSAVPVDSQSGSLADSSFYMHAKQTRLGIFTSTPTDYGKFNIRVETDFFGSGGTEAYSNSYGIRLRRAYGELGNLLVGQEWSTFIDLASIGETADFGGPAGSLFIRQAQVRWTQPFSFGSLQFAIENPETTLAAYLFEDEKVPKEGSGEYLPDFIARANFDTDFGHFSVAGLFRQLIVDNGIYDDDTYGSAVSITASIPIVGKDVLTGQFNYGNALGRYMEAEFADVYIDPVTHSIETADQWGGLASYKHYWLGNLRSTVIYSYAERDNDTALTGDAADAIYQSLHANLFWSPVERINLGVEYIWGYRKLENGDDGDINRIQFAFQYNF